MLIYPRADSSRFFTGSEIALPLTDSQPTDQSTLAQRVITLIEPR